MQLFSFEDPKPHKALEAFGGAIQRTQAIQAGTGANDVMADTAFASREKLREERATLVAQLSRRTGEPHRDIHARINRKTGAASVTAATAEQLRKGNELIQRLLAR
jgi:succinate dehydrogenase/fumarate reductase flavoprotein subunit